MHEACTDLVWLRDAELSPEEQAALSAHLAACASCRDARSDLDALVPALREAQAAPLRLPRRLRVGAAVSAAAAAALLVAAAFLRSPGEPGPGRGPAAVSLRLEVGAGGLHVSRVERPLPAVIAVSTTWNESRVAASAESSARGAAANRSVPGRRQPLALLPGGDPSFQAPRAYSRGGEPAELWVVCSTENAAARRWHAWSEIPESPAPGRR